ncbi:MAG TPA: hypothetical protein VMT58_09660 [Candidatus Binataceae bacterium]|nr:hypothetical protein [Candidatus Binataceae bacterium]
MARITLTATLLGATLLASCAATAPNASTAAAKWYLMVPPPMMPLVKDAQGYYKQNPNAPLATWAPFKTFDTQNDCMAAAKDMEVPSRCIASTDPALKGNPNLPKTTSAPK